MDHALELDPDVDHGCGHARNLDGPPHALRPPLAPPPPSGATAALLALTLAAAVGALLQVVVPCARCAAPFVGAACAVLYVSLSGALPQALRRALAAQEAFATILATLAVICALGTLVVQGQGEGFYRGAYGPALAAAILRLGLDDAFHSLWFAAIAGVFSGSVILSAACRWPPSRSNAGFHLAHLGLLVAIAGAAASATVAVRGRLELRAGETAGEVRPTTAHRAHPAAADRLPLGFAFRLDRFDVERYGSGLRIGYYERHEDGWRLRASFEPEVGVGHQLPGGASFRVTALPDGQAPAAVLRLADDAGAVSDVGLLPGAGGHRMPDGTGALVLEPRPPEPRSFRSTVTVIDRDGTRSGAVAVNAPFHHGGWTFYQASYDPDDPRFSALDAVRDPGAAWVFAGLVLASAGVAHALFAGAWRRRPRHA